MSFFLTKWIKGWHLERLFKHTTAGEISVADASVKVVNAIDDVLQYEDEAKLITEAISDDAALSTDEVIAVIKDARERILQVEFLPDIPEQIEDVKFSDDEEVNTFVHDLFKTIALAFNDGKISLFEAIGIITRVIAFIKERKS